MLKELGYETIALTDHGTLTGIDDFVKAAKDNGIKPVPGVELYIKGAEANVRHDNICEATTLLQNAQRDLDRLKTCKTCV